MRRFAYIPLQFEGKYLEIGKTSRKRTRKFYDLSWRTAEMLQQHLWWLRLELIPVSAWLLHTGPVEPRGKWGSWRHGSLSPWRRQACWILISFSYMLVGSFKGRKGRQRDRHKSLWLALRSHPVHWTLRRPPEGYFLCSWPWRLSLTEQMGF